MTRTARRTTAIVVLGAGALLVVLGSLLPLYGMTEQFGGGPDPAAGTRTYALTGWESVVEPPFRVEGVEDVDGVDEQDRIPVYGHALVAAAALVALGAVLQLRPPRPAAIGRSAAVAGLGLLLGTLWAAVETTSKLFGEGDATHDREFVGSGTWTVLAAAALVLAGVVLAHERPVPATADGETPRAGDDDVDTPPLGIPAPVIEVRPINEDDVAGQHHPTGGNPSTVEPWPR
ncbi:hypothetical protein [Saccharothrix longispora]|uniref:hypothetical protein n=1 Tax=Saccharothrix longispora TaxID=33920 RepID=UPI0028FD2BFC|nr:hypothetical protein [Saccharothrix longispora]MBY8849362.1 hypothetical protein [Saccharothrix sp. MB29]MDU0288142.1 hypothetical protein [Saccharothrix longispora]